MFINATHIAATQSPMASCCSSSWRSWGRVREQREKTKTTNLINGWLLTHEMFFLPYPIRRVVSIIASSSWNRRAWRRRSHFVMIRGRGRSRIPILRGRVQPYSCHWASRFATSLILRWGSLTLSWCVKATGGRGCHVHWLWRWVWYGCGRATSVERSGRGLAFGSFSVVLV